MAAAAAVMAAATIATLLATVAATMAAATMAAVAMVAATRGVMWHALITGPSDVERSIVTSNCDI